MFKHYLHGRIAKLERAYGYDATYMHEILEASLSAFVRFALFQSMSTFRSGVPKDAWYAAKLAGALSEDCGPCAQLVSDMAVRDGMDPQKISALLRGDIEQAGADAAIGYRYGMSVATNNPNAVTISEAIEKRFGKRGLVSLDLCVASARVYPALKRGLGHGAACAKIVVADETIMVKHAA